MQLCCSQNLNIAYRFNSTVLGLCYANPPLSWPAKVLTKIAFEGARAILFSPDGRLD